MRAGRKIQGPAQLMSAAVTDFFDSVHPEFHIDSWIRIRSRGEHVYRCARGLPRAANLDAGRNRWHTGARWKWACVQQSGDGVASHPNLCGKESEIGFAVAIIVAGNQLKRRICWYQG